LSEEKKAVDGKKRMRRMGRRRFRQDMRMQVDEMGELEREMGRMGREQRSQVGGKRTRRY
jgi:hypothetical protein